MLHAAVSLALLAPLTAVGPFGKELKTSVKPIDDSLVVYSEENLFAAFQAETDLPPHIYPVFSHNQIPLTRNFPMREGFPFEETDHPHHRSLWFAHGSINGIDFWHGEGKFRRTDLRATTSRNHSILLYDGDLLAEDKVIAKMQLQIVFSSWELARAIDWKIRISPADNVNELTFGDTKEGTMAIRTRPELRLNGTYAKGKSINSEGVRGADIWGKRAKWVGYWAPVDGKTAGMAIFDSPTNHAHPTWWQARDYGLVAANPFGKHDFEGGDPGAGDFTIRNGERLELNYRFLFFEGEVQTRTMNQIYNDWTKQPLASQL